MPILHLLAGPNGAGKSTYAARVLQPITHLPFVDADVIAIERWPDAPIEHTYDAARLAETERRRLTSARRSFITETVFSHVSKNELVDDALQLGYLVHLHVVMIPVELAVARVAECVIDGGHDVPERKVRERYNRLWALVARARDHADRTEVLDNSRAADPFRVVAVYEHGRAVGVPQWPSWTPEPIGSA